MVSDLLNGGKKGRRGESYRAAVVVGIKRVRSRPPLWRNTRAARPEEKLEEETPCPKTRRQIISAVICACPGDRECAAARLGLPLKKFDHHAYETAGSLPLTDDQIRLLEEETGTHHLVDYLAAQ